MSTNLQDYIKPYDPLDEYVLIPKGTYSGVIFRQEIKESRISNSRFWMSFGINIRVKDNPEEFRIVYASHMGGLDTLHALSVLSRLYMNRDMKVKIVHRSLPSKLSPRGLIHHEAQIIWESIDYPTFDS